MEYCPDCGEKLSSVEREGKDRNYCERCDKIHWLDSSPCVGVLVENDGELLMVQRGIEPWKGRWSIPAGYMEHGENPKAAALRELEEETGVSLDRDDLSIADSVDLTHPDGKEVVLIIYRTELNSVPELSTDDEIIKTEFMTPSEISEEVSPLIEKLKPLLD